jgi:carboxyl-terminal processing protease
MEIPILKRMLIAAHLRSALDLWFAHWEAIPDLNLDREFEDYLANVADVAERRAFDLASMRFLASFRNGHTYFSDSWLRETEGGHLPFFARPVGDVWVITVSGTSEIPMGAKILAVDGVPILDFFVQHEPFIAASSSRAAAELLFFRSYLFPQVFRLKLDGERDVNCIRGTTKTLVARSPMLAFVRGDVAHLRIPSFANPEFERAAIDLIGVVPDQAALVVDVRGNSGGDTPMALIERLMDRPFRTWIEATPQHSDPIGSNDMRTKMDLTGPEAFNPVTMAWRGKLAILIDGGCFSAAEDFVAPFKDNGRATLFGEATAGSSGQPYRRAYENGMAFAIGARRQYFADGTVFEGLGVAPDVLVAAHMEDFSAGRDRALEAAVEAL